MPAGKKKLKKNKVRKESATVTAAGAAPYSDDDRQYKVGFDPEKADYQASLQFESVIRLIKEVASEARRA